MCTILQKNNETISTNKTLYFIIVLTIVLISCNEQQNIKSRSMTFNSKLSSNSSFQQQSNDLEHPLLTISSLILHKNNQRNVSELKLILYYISKMLRIILEEEHSQSNESYISIETFITLIIKVLQKEGTITEDEKRLFLNEILLCLGVFFKNVISNTQTSNNTIKLEHQELLIMYYASAYSYLNDYVNQHYKYIKQLIYANYNANQNEIEDENMKTKGNIIKKNTNYVELLKLNKSLYYYLLLIIKDTVIGKKRFNDIKNCLKNDLLYEIIIIYILQKSVNAPHKRQSLIGSIFEFIYEQIINCDDNFNFYISLLFEHFKDIIKRDKVLKENCEALLANILINKVDTNVNITNTFILVLSNNNLLLMDCILLVDFIYNISNKISNINEFQKQNKILLALIDLLNNNQHNIFPDIITNNSHDTTSKLIPKKKIILNTQKYITIIKNFTHLFSVIPFNKNELAIYTTNYANFYILFYNHCISNYEFDTNNDKNYREQIYNSNINLIYDLLLLSNIFDGHNNKTEVSYSRNIINLIKMLFYFINEEIYFNITDAYLIFNILGSIYKNKFNNQDIKKSFALISDIYKITFSIIIITVDKYKIPISLSILNNDIHNKTSPLYSTTVKDSKIAFNENELNSFLNQLHNNNEFLSLLEKTLLTFNNNIPQNNNLKPLEQFNQIIDTIYTILFGHSSALNTFFENQDNIKQDYNNIPISARLSENTQDVITNGGTRLDIKDVSLNFTMGIEGNNREQENNNIIFENNMIALPLFQNVNNDLDLETSTNLRI